jgi:hypothetical protein
VPWPSSSSIFIRSEITKVEATSCYFRPTKRETVGAEDQYRAENGLAVCSNTTAVPHEYFGHTGKEVPLPAIPVYE